MRINLELVILQKRGSGIQLFPVACFRKVIDFLEHRIDAVVYFPILHNRLGAFFRNGQLFIFQIRLHFVDFIKNMFSRHQERLFMESVEEKQCDQRQDRKQND